MSVAQDACLAAMLGIERLGRPERFSAWLAGIGLNPCRRRMRARASAHWSCARVSRPESSVPESMPGRLSTAASADHRIRRVASEPEPTPGGEPQS
jgi:DNA-directed RNA polymerase specialized sigma24 family protein